MDLQAQAPKPNRNAAGTNAERTQQLEQRLKELVAFDTQNPKGHEAPCAQHLAQGLADLGAARVDIVETGRHSSVLAHLTPTPTTVILNAHIDTVPANAGYTTDPLQLRRFGDKLQGLGSADTKGAIAAILQALFEHKQSGKPFPAGVGVLFSGDEERSGSCMRALIDQRERLGLGALQRAVVCEPTGCAVGTRHRGIGGGQMQAHSPGGHSSQADHVPAPLAILARAAVALHELGQAHKNDGSAGFEGWCLNIGQLTGGVAGNVIPSFAQMAFTVRPAPGTNIEAVIALCEQAARAAAGPEASWSADLCNPSFFNATPQPLLHALGLPPTAVIDLDFWTEAALLAEAGVEAVVFGPGDITQAHAPDEFVTDADLNFACAAFVHLLDHQLYQAAV